MISCVNAFKSYRLTDRQTETTEIINHAASLVVKNDEPDGRGKVR